MFAASGYQSSSEELKMSTVFDKIKDIDYQKLCGYRPINRQLEIACSDLNKVPSYVAYHREVTMVQGGYRYLS